MFTDGAVGTCIGGVRYPAWKHGEGWSPHDEAFFFEKENVGGHISPVLCAQLPSVLGDE